MKAESKRQTGSIDTTGTVAPQSRQNETRDASSGSRAWTEGSQSDTYYDLRAAGFSKTEAEILALVVRNPDLDDGFQKCQQAVRAIAFPLADRFCERCPLPGWTPERFRQRMAELTAIDLAGDKRSDLLQQAISIIATISDPEKARWIDLAFQIDFWGSDAHNLAMLQDAVTALVLNSEIPLSLE